MTIKNRSLAHARRRPYARLLCTVLMSALLGGCGGGSSSHIANGPSDENPSVANPTVEGPIAGDAFISATGFPLDSVGYQQAEYFISGSAHSYVAKTPLTSDGKWSVAEDAAAAYKTRIMVYRPIRDGDFNGTVIVEWLNVSGGLDAAPDWVMAHNELIRRGYAWVGVSAQKVGVDGGAGIIQGVVNFNLKTVNPARYGSLLHPGDSFSYDMYSQAAQAVLHPQGIDPLGGLKIEHAIAAGESQSAFRMTTYVNALATNQLFDGFFIHSRGAGSAPLSAAPQADVPAPDVVNVRSDLQVPVMMLQTESDLFLLGSLPDRQADSDTFRLWEVAGTAHADTYTTLGAGDLGNDPSFANVVSIDSPVPGIISCAKPINSGPQHFVVSAAFAALQNWIATGTAPANAQRLQTAGSPAAYVYDNLGNVLGGVRTPYVDVPIAKLSGAGQTGSGFCFLFGTTELFDDATLGSLYPTHAAYVAAVGASVDNAVADGFLLEADGALIKTAAQNSTIGNH
ncbi:MAG TPA: alpha/beta hydrolase domain-containing protein [Spongiibacteraceae bacterium]|nr:alpha/beta hydrolase domain-containing protein [Spongiibacteraceae bacterium]